MGAAVTVSDNYSTYLACHQQSHISSAQHGHHNFSYHKEGLLRTGNIHNTRPSESVHAIADCVFWLYRGTVACFGHCE